MKTLGGKPRGGKVAKSPDDLSAVLAHHDAAINSLGGRMSSVETGLKTLQGEVHHGFAGLNSKLDRLDARPTFNFHQTIKTVLNLAVLFSLVVGGIVWVTTNQFSGVVAQQKFTNDALISKLDRHDTVLQSLMEQISRLGWGASVKEGN